MRLEMPATCPRPPADSPSETPSPVVSAGASVQCSRPVGVRGNSSRRRATSWGNRRPPEGRRRARTVIFPSGVASAAPVTAPSSVSNRVAGVFGSNGTPRSSADLASRAIRAVPLTSCMPCRLVARSNTWNATRQPAWKNPFTEVVACRNACRSGPAMIPSPNNDVSYNWGRSLVRSAFLILRMLIGLGPTDRPPVPAPGRSP